MKKILCIILSMLMLLSFSACDGGGDVGGDIEAPSEPEEPKALTINGTDISKYHVVYKTANEHYQFKSVALKFIDFVKTEYGVELNYSSDLVPEKEYEIVFGETARRSACNDLASDYASGGYRVSVKGKNVVIASDYVNGCELGYEEFITMINDVNGKVVDFDKSGEKRVIKVACVGDSITQGINSSDPVNMTYPAYLQDMLGSNYYVLNAGHSGYSIAKTDQFSYFNSPQYKAALDMVPDVVIFALGTNDCNPGDPLKNWDNPANDRENKYVNGMKELLDSFKAVNPDCQIYVMLPTYLFKVGADSWNSEAWNANIDAHALPLTQQVAIEYGYQIIDMYSWSKENSSIFADGLHPINEGYKIYAENVYANIKDTIKGSDDE